MSIAIRRALVFVVTMTAWAFIWWAAGYDFDRRGPDIAYFLFIAVFTSFGLMFCFDFED